VVNATPGKETRYPLYRRLGGPEGRTGRVQKNLAPVEIRSPGSSSIRTRQNSCTFFPVHSLILLQFGAFDSNLLKATPNKPHILTLRKESEKRRRESRLALSYLTLHYFTFFVAL
jgi:hypothetical protein